MKKRARAFRQSVLGTVLSGILFCCVSLPAMTAGQSHDHHKQTVAAPLTDPGETVVTHHETIPNPVFGSTFRVTANCRNVTPCDWESPATWTQNQIPDTNTKVIVDGNVRINGQSALALDVGIYPGGKLSFNTMTDTRLRTGNVIVFAGGSLYVGSVAAPVGATKVAEIVIRDLPFSGDPSQHLRGILVIDGTIKIHGRALIETYIRTASEPRVGTTTILLETSATAAGWQIGDSVVIPNSNQCRVASGPCPDETEDRTITAISSNGKTITLSSPLQFDHRGARNGSNNLDFLPHVINKKRNVIIRSENPNGIRGHMLLHGRADVDVRYALVQGFGRTDIRDLGPTNQKGRYPIHAHHLIGPLAGQANDQQFTFIGNTVDFGSENRTQNRKWGIALHGSHFGLIERNIVDFPSGAGIVTEDATETGNWFKKNFVVRVVGGNGARTEDRDPGDGSKLGRSGVAFWFNGGGNNLFEENVAAAVAECTYCYGYKLDNVYNDPVNIPNTRGSDPYQGGGTMTDSYSIGLNYFVRNETYAVPNGLTIWWVCTEYETPRDNCTSLVKDFRLWHHHRWGYFGYETSRMTMDGFIARNDAAALTNQYESVMGIFLHDYMTRRTVITNADIQGSALGIDAPVHADARGASGVDAGLTIIQNSFFSAGSNIGVTVPWSVNGAGDLSPKTTVVRNVRFGHPSTRQESNLYVAGSTGGGPYNQNLRNDIWVYDYNSAPGTNGDDLYITPTYQPSSRCDNTIGNCASDISANYPQITGGRVYPMFASPVLDTTPPVTSVTGPDNESTVSGAITVSANATDNVGIASVQFKLNGANLGAADTSAPYSISWNTNGIADGIHILNAVARDAAGNATPATPIKVIVNNFVASSPIAAYSFDEGSGNIATDNSGNSHHGAINGAQWRLGRFGKALLLDGFNDFVSVGDAAMLDLTAGMTLEAWVHPTKARSRWQSIIFKEQPGGQAYSLYSNSNTSQPAGRVFVGSDTDVRGTSYTPVLTWTHLALTYDGIVMRLYVNGIQTASRNVSGSMVVSGGPLSIGGNSIWGEHFGGRIDEVRIYNRALTAAEIQLDMSTPISPSS